MATAVLFGIPNCDTVKKARQWLDKHRIEYRFHDFRKDGLDAVRLKKWFAELGLDSVLNKRSRTWRELDETVKQDVTEAKAIKLILAQPSLIKRPVLEYGTQFMVGFDDKRYKSLFKA